MMESSEGCMLAALGFDADGTGEGMAPPGSVALADMLRYRA